MSVTRQAEPDLRDAFQRDGYVVVRGLQDAEGSEAQRATWWRAVWAQILCALLLVPLALYYLLLLGTWLHLYANDFGKFYFATQQWWHGLSMYASSPANRMMVVGGGFHDYLDMNPPHFHILIWPLMFLPLRLAARVWLSLNFAVAVIAGLLIARELEWRLRLTDALPLAAAILLCGATGATIITGQYMGPLLLLTVLAWRDGRHDRWTGCGAWLGVLIALKPFLAIFLPYLVLRRRWRALLSLIMAGAGSFVMGLLIFGWATHVAWWDSLGAVDWIWAGMNGSLYGLLARNLLPSPYFTPVLHATAFQVRIYWAAAAGAVGLCTLTIAGRSFDRDFAALLLCALLMSPRGWVYYLWLVAPPCLALWPYDHRSLLRVALVCLAIPLVLASAWPTHAWATVTIGSAYSWGTLGLWLAVVTSSAGRVNQTVTAQPNGSRRRSPEPHRVGGVASSCARPLTAAGTSAACLQKLRAPSLQQTTE
jgi:hypothetical protein